MPEPGWPAALQVLGGALRAPAWQRADATVILSNHFVRCLLLPWRSELADAREELAFARHHFVRVYGTAAETWTLRLDSGTAGAGRVACAVDAELPAALSSLCAPANLRLRSLQPYLMSSFNQWRRQLRGPACCFALVERGKLCLAAFRQGCWQGLHTCRIGQNWAWELPLILDRERHLLALADAGTLFLFAPEDPDAEPAAPAAWSLRRLAPVPRPGFAPAADASYAPALSG